MTVLDNVRERRDEAKREAQRILNTVEAERRNLTAPETARFDRLVEEVKEFNDRIAELEGQARDEARAVAVRKDTLPNGEQRVYANSRGGTYHPGPDSPSFFRDLLLAQRGHADAADRLRTNNAEMGLERRAIGNTGGTGGSGGEFAPPGYLLDQFVAMARPGRVTADLFHHEVLPPGISSVNLPKVSTGTTVAPQTTQNTLLSQTDMTTSLISAPICTIGGKQVISVQLLEQSGIPIDQAIFTDLTADYARQLDTQALVGTGTGGQLRGYLTPASANVINWTQAAPTAAGFYGQLAKLQGQINATRYSPPDTVVMSPRRWAWLASYTDSTGRPLVAPTAGQGFNSMAAAGPAVAAGKVGEILGMECFTDPNIPVNLGAGTNQDVVLMMPRDDVWLWESPLRAEAFTAPYSDSAGVLLRVLGFAAMVPDRYLASLGQINGTGLVTPTFAN